jgi:hypothetical protein
MRALIACLLASLAVVPVATGCGADDFNPDVVDEAAEKTTGVGSMRMDFTATVAGQELGGDGFFDMEAGRGEMSMEMPSAGTFDVVLAGEAMYMRFPEELRGSLPGDEEWARIDLGRAFADKGLDFGALMSAGGTDPTQSLQQLRGAGDVERVGEEEVRGVETTRYEAVVDLRKALREVEDEDARRSMQRAFELSGQKTLPIEVWIDDEGLVRRQRFEQVGAKGQPAVQMDMELYDYGASEEIEVPAASDTFDLTDEVRKQGLGG